MTTLHATEIYRDSALMVIAITSVDFQQSTSYSWKSVYVQIQPYAVIVCDAPSIYAVDMDANVLDLEALRERVSNLDVILASHVK